MFITKKITSTLLLTLFLAMTSTLTVAAGKIKNATIEEVAAALETTIKRMEITLEALNNGADKEKTLELLNNAKQISKEIDVTRLGRVKAKATTQMRKARVAAKKNDLEGAKAHVAQSIKHYYEFKKAFLEF